MKEPNERVECRENLGLILEKVDSQMTSALQPPAMFLERMRFTCKCGVSGEAFAETEMRQRMNIVRLSDKSDSALSTGSVHRTPER